MKPACMLIKAHTVVMWASEPRVLVPSLVVMGAESWNLCLLSHYDVCLLRLEILAQTGRTQLAHFILESDKISFSN